MIYKPRVAIAYMYNLRQGHLNVKQQIFHVEEYIKAPSVPAEKVSLYTFY